jgi:hypothetical protein
MGQTQGISPPFGGLLYFSIHRRNINPGDIVENTVMKNPPGEPSGSPGRT